MRLFLLPKQMIASNASHLDVVVGELTVVGGQRRSDVPHMALMTPPRRAHTDRRPETLAVFLDLGGDGGGGLAAAMLENLQRAYWRSSGPVTSALRQAIMAANAHLREENRLLPISQRRRGGLVCAVMREDDVYLAQVGPAKALLATGEQVMRFPKDNREQLPMGVASSLNIQYSHSALSAGDCLLLTGESWSTEVPDNALASVLSAKHSAAEQMMLALERQAGSKPFSALVLQSAARLAPSAPTRAQTSQTPVEMEIGAELESRLAWTDIGGAPDDVGTSSWPPSRPLVGFSLSRDHLDRSREGIRRFGLALGDGLRTFFMRVLPEPEAVPITRKRRRTMAENVPVMAGIAIAIPLLVAFVVVTFYLQRSAAERREALLGQALAAAEAARQADEPEAHALWEAALTKAEEALQAAPDDESMVAMRTEARAKLDELDGVLRPELIMLYNYGGVGSRRLAVSRMQVFVLDPEQDQVTQHALNPERRSATGENPELVAYRGESVSDKEIGDLQAIAWMEGGAGRAGDALFILTAEDALLQHSLSWGLSWAVLESELAAANVRAICPFNGKLYVLDSAENTIWRFPAADSGFGQAEHYFQVPPPDLRHAIDMTIDGSVYILLEDGQIQKFFEGEPKFLQLRGLPQPLVRPVALVSEGDPTSGALYVADAGADSIVALTKDGQFLYQVKADNGRLADLEALAVEEASRMLYVFANGALYALALPPVPQNPNLR